MLSNIYSKTAMSYSSYYKALHKELTSVDKKFINWINKVEEIVETSIKFKLLELPDEAYMIYFEDGLSAQDMAKIVSTNFERYLNAIC